jgi:hypothetical protein
MRRALISYDLPQAPAEDAFRAAAAEFNAAFAELPPATGMTGMFLVLREVRGTMPTEIQVRHHRESNWVGIDCPLHVHVFEPNTQSVVASLAATLTGAVKMADTYCQKNSISFDAEEIIQTIASVAGARRARSDA